MITRKAHIVWLCLFIPTIVLSGWALLSLFNTTARITYQFEYKGYERQFTLTIPLEDYRNYKEKPRPDYNLAKSDFSAYFAQYINMATDSHDDGLIDSLVCQLEEIALAEGLSDSKKASLALNFIQSLAYTKDNTPAGLGEYPRYPVETLFEMGGDCEDTSILLAAIMTDMEYDVALLLFENLDHIGLGINFPVKHGNSWIYEGKRYWYLDASGTRPIGWCPEEYAQTAAYVYPLAVK